jgi:hypothetical protein
MQYICNRIYIMLVPKRALLPYHMLLSVQVVGLECADLYSLTRLSPEEAASSSRHCFELSTRPFCE